ncbi:MAG: 4'-phosphopantetheinyl transferase family protein [Niabella sp.]
MSLFFQKDINVFTRVGIWKIEEDEDFFKSYVPTHREVTHPHKRLQHLSGRFLLKYLFPYFPSHLIQIADTRKPFLPDAAFHFSISHCGDYAAAIVSREYRVGIDIEIPADKVKRIGSKFVSEDEWKTIKPETPEDFTQIWSAKEAVFKWYGEGEVDFKNHIRLGLDEKDAHILKCSFTKTGTSLNVHTRFFPGLCLSYVVTGV